MKLETAKAAVLVVMKDEESIHHHPENDLLGMAWQSLSSIVNRSSSDNVNVFLER